MVIVDKVDGTNRDDGDEGRRKIERKGAVIYSKAVHNKQRGLSLEGKNMACAPSQSCLMR